MGTGIDFTPALTEAHIADEDVVAPGTGLDLAAPLQFSHAANLPFSDRGTGISFEPATAFVHISNEPVQALGTGITLDSGLAHNQTVNAVVRDAAVRNAGYQARPMPNQWFGGPELATDAPFFERRITRREGSMVLRDASGLVVDSLNYGALVDPWAAEGYQGTSGSEHNGCYVTPPGWAGFVWPPVPTAGVSNTSAGRFPDGQDTDSNCADFVTSPATILSAPAGRGASNIKVASVTGFEPGETIQIDTGANLETAVIATVGTAGGTRTDSATTVGATAIPVASSTGFRNGQTITIDSGGDAETAVVASVRRSVSTVITVTAPLTRVHPGGAQVSGTGITLTAPLNREHASGAEAAGSSSTPGAANQYYRAPR